MAAPLSAVSRPDDPILGSALETLARRLDASSTAPLITAFSGGGDSLALLLAARAFARRCGRPLIAVHVDHGLQPSSAAWADDAEAVAGRLEIAFVRRTWTGAKPLTGLPAAARAARHRLIADACRDLGAGVVLVGHTFDDQLENVLMRDSGAPLGPLREWTPSPVWPEGRGVFLCRPLLAVRRADIRRWLLAQGLAWLDDPANDDPRYARARARQALAQGAKAFPREEIDVRALAGLWRVTPWGGVAIDRKGLLRAAPDRAVRLLQMSIACASGAPGPARQGRAARILARLLQGEGFAASLGGARIEAGADEVLLEREAGEADRGGLRPIVLDAGQTRVWDGRFEVSAGREPVRIEALRGQAGRLDPRDRASVLSVPASVRPGLPVFRSIGNDDAPRLALAGSGAHVGNNSVRCRALCEARLASANGLVTREADIWTIARMAKSPPPPYVVAGSKD
jgi:tRNA(Ile)-lysidine synthase